MESAIKYVCDITYQSELTPHPENNSYLACWLGEGLNSQTLRYNLRRLRSVSYLLI